MNSKWSKLQGFSHIRRSPVAAGGTAYPLTRHAEPPLHPARRPHPPRPKEDPPMTVEMNGIAHIQLTMNDPNRSGGKGDSALPRRLSSRVARGSERVVWPRRSNRTATRAGRLPMDRRRSRIPDFCSQAAAGPSPHRTPRCDRNRASRLEQLRPDQAPNSEPRGEGGRLSRPEPIPIGAFASE